MLTGVGDTSFVFIAPPKINVPPRFRDVCTFEKGENVVLKIPFTGNPKPTIKWIRDNEEVRGPRSVMCHILFHNCWCRQSQTAV